MKTKIAAFFLAFALVSCAASKMNLPEQEGYSRKDLGVTNIFNANRCQYLRTLIGGSSDGSFSGFCFMSYNTIYIRMIDSTNPAVGRYLSIPKSEIKSYSVHTSWYGTNELQIRTADYLYGIRIRSDDDKTFNQGTAAYISEIDSWGIPRIDTSGAIPIHLPNEKPSQPIIYLPTNKK